VEVEAVVAEWEDLGLADSAVAAAAEWAA